MGLDVHRDHTFINPAAAKMLGYSRAELLGCPGHPVWHHTKADASPYPDDECLLQAVLRDGVVHRVSNEIFWRKDGTSFQVEYTATPIYDQGLVVGTVVTFADISARKQAEKALRKSASNLRAALNATADGILAVDTKSKVLFFNQRFSELWNIPQAILDTGDDNVLLGHVLTQLSDPEAFLKNVTRLYTLDESSFDTIHF